MQIRLIAPFHVFVAETERHLSCKQAHVGANPTEGSISNTLHVVTVSIPRCERGGAGATPAVGTISSIVRKAKSRASGLQNRITQCEPGAHVQFKRVKQREKGPRVRLHALCPKLHATFGYERASELTWFGTKRRPGQHRGIRPL